MAAGKIPENIIKLQVKAGQANPAPPIGPALGQYGLNIMDFCTQFNTATKDRMGLVLPVVISVYADKSFSFIIKSPPAAVLLLQAIGASKGADDSIRNKVGTVSWDTCREIAQKKMDDLNAFDIDKAAAMIAGTARSMGIIVTESPV